MYGDVTSSSAEEAVIWMLCAFAYEMRNISLSRLCCDGGIIHSGVIYGAGNTAVFIAKQIEMPQSEWSKQTRKGIIAGLQIGKDSPFPPPLWLNHTQNDRLYLAEDVTLVTQSLLFIDSLFHPPLNMSALDFAQITWGSRRSVCVVWFVFCRLESGSR